MAKKKKIKSKFDFKWLILAGILLIGGYLYQHQTLLSQAPEKSEDELSLYTMPPDVRESLSQAKASGTTVLGVKTDAPYYHIPVLMYHYVEHVKDRGDKVRISLNTLPETLDLQIKTMKSAGYAFLTASDLADILDGIKTPPPKSVVLTFDDGYRDFYTDAFPILKKYQVKATEYVISGFLNLPNNLTKEQLKEVAQSGLVEIGAHTVHHLALGGANAKKAQGEIESSKIQLEQEINQPVVSFAYPYGSFDLAL